MIRSSQLQSVIKEATQYEDAISKFEGKYHDYPGDMGDATNYWGASTADGNGNQIIEGAAAANTTGEMFQFWNQLALASFLPGKFTGIAGPASAIDTVPGTNAPKSRVSGAGWSVYNLLNFAGDNNNYALNYGNVLAFGATSPGTITIAGILKPDEAARLDTKMDDGKPATGKMIAVEDGGFSSSASAKCTTSASATDYTGTYNTSGKVQKACAFYLISRELNLQGSASGNAGGPTVAINGVCDNTGPLACAPGTPTADNGATACGTTRTWTCAGAHGGANSGTCSFTYRACPVNGVCNNAVALGCSAGTAGSDNGQSACGTTRQWVCLGQNGGANSGACSFNNAACPTNCYWKFIGGNSGCCGAGDVANTPDITTATPCTAATNGQQFSSTSSYYNPEGCVIQFGPSAPLWAFELDIYQCVCQ